MNQIIKFKIDDQTKKLFQKTCVDNEEVASEVLRTFVQEYVNGHDSTVDTTEVYNYYIINKRTNNIYRTYYKWEDIPDTFKNNKKWGIIKGVISNE